MNDNNQSFINNTDHKKWAILDCQFPAGSEAESAPVGRRALPTPWAVPVVNPAAPRVESRAGAPLNTLLIQPTTWVGYFDWFSDFVVYWREDIGRQDKTWQDNILSYMTYEGHREISPQNFQESGLGTLVIPCFTKVFPRKFCACGYMGPSQAACSCLTGPSF